MYNLPRDRGLTNALEGGVTIAELVQPTAVNNLDLLTAGPEVTTPAELLASHRLGEVLDETRHGYDTIIIDSSPLLAVTDPSIIAAVADGILLVVRIASTWRHDIERTTELLKTLGASVVGIVINFVSCDQLGNGHGYGYGYGYGYGKPYGASVEPGQGEDGMAAKRVTNPHGTNGRIGFGHGTSEPTNAE